MTTPHIEAAVGDFADTVLLPGDPLRARHIAQTLFEDAREVSGVRNMLAYTGSHRGRRLSVMGSGMGIPSCAIYATELVRVYGVRRLIRVGTCGGLGDTELGDIVLAQSASTDSRFNRLQFGGHDFAAAADFGLLRAVADTADRQRLALRIGGVFSSDCFYGGDPDLLARLASHRLLAIEMEAAGLYGVAAREGAQALAVLTVSDQLVSQQRMSAGERESGLQRMLGLVLDSLAPA